MYLKDADMKMVGLIGHQLKTNLTKGFDKEEIESQRQNIKYYGRCCGCYEEYGTDGYPDR